MSSVSQPIIASPETGYDPFASIYDRHMAVEFAGQVIPILDKLVLNDLAPRAAVLDLCCGSGRVTQRLLERGFRVTGVDASEPMLRLARRNAPGAQLLLADARHFSLLARYPAVVSTFNSLAHLHTLADLHRALCNAYAMLVPGGRIVFDLSMSAQYERCWCGAYSYLGGGDACVVRPSYDASQRMARNDITILHRSDALAWRDRPTSASASKAQATLGYMRTQFTVWQKAHSESEVRQALAGAGYGSVECFDAERDLAMSGESGRYFFRARRP